MRTVVIYDSMFGNTARIARAIGAGAATHGSVQVVGLAEAPGAVADPPDLLLVGGPTRNHGITPDLRAFLDTLGPHGLAGVRAATFDTRYRMATLLSGSAAKDAAGRLRRAGAEPVAAPESFFMSRAERRPEAQGLEAGEVERAEAWGRDLAAGVAAQAAA